jgi:signal transduction histidine kinase
MRPLGGCVKEVLLRGGLLAHKAAGTGLTAWITAPQEVARGLHPRVLIERGLAGALAEAAARSPIPTSFESTLDEAAVPRHVALTAYYVATEALANIAKHAQALRARIELSGNSRQVHVRVTGDGIGGANPAGGGLSGLRDRTQAIDGELRITSPPGRGTVVEASLPLTGA